MLRRLAFTALLCLPLAACGQLPVSKPGDEAATAEGDVGANSAQDADVADDAAKGSGPSSSGDGEAAYPGATSDAAAGRAGAAGTDDEGEADDGPAAASSSAPAPADMLNAEELERAAELALGSGELRSMAAGAVDRSSLAEAAAEGDLEALSSLAERPSYRLLYTQRLAAPKGEAEAGRAAEVAVYRYDTGTLERSKVDLATGRVEALAADPNLPAPLVHEEVMEAAAVARASEEVRQALEADGLDPATAKVNGILTVSQEDGAVCAAKRCVRLFFATERRPLPGFNVVVNLNDLSLVEVVPMPGFEEAQP